MRGRRERERKERQEPLAEPGDNFSLLHSGYQRGMKDVCRQGLEYLKKRL